MTADPKEGKRIVDPAVIRVARLRYPECAACGAPGGNGHHVLPKDYRPAGADVVQYIVSLCGSGTSRCHGAFHGSPYVVQTGNWVLDVERRDAEWVARHIGRTLLAERPDVIEYLHRRLGRNKARWFLERTYYIEEVELAIAGY